MTRDELIAQLAAKREKSIVFDWNQLVSAIAKTSVINKNQIVNAVNTNNGPLLMNLMTAIFKEEKRASALDEVNQKLVDEKLSVTELLELLG